MKLLYINPPKNPNIRYRENIMPLSLLYLGAVARRQCETKILDLKVANKDGEENFCSEVAREIVDYNPDIVGITCLFSGDIINVMNIAAQVKKIRANIIVMIGGMHPTLFAREIITYCKDIDIVIMGEGEETTIRLLKAISDGSDFSGIDGIVYRRDGKYPLLTTYDMNNELLQPIQEYNICCVPKTEYIQNVDCLPAPAYELFHFEDYYCDTSDWYNPDHVPINGLVVPILTSRSCPNCCNFCSMNEVMGLKYRARSAQSVIDEMSFLYNKYNIRYFRVMDDNFTLDKRRTIQICNGIISKNMKIAIECFSGLFINSLDDEVIDALVSAGLIKAAIGIESGSDYIRNQIVGKHLRREKIYSTVQSFERYPKVYLQGMFIIGFPEDTEETIQDSLDMIKELDLDDISFGTLVPLPGTRLFEQCRSENLFLYDVDYQNLWKDEGVFSAPFVDQFFIKPYALSIKQLKQYYKQFSQLRLEKRMIAKEKGKFLATYHKQT